MERLLVLPLIAIVGRAALSRPPVSRAAGETPAPGTIMTIAGNGQNAATGDGGPAAKAAVGTALWMTFDAAGSLFIAATGDINRVRRISTAGIITRSEEHTSELQSPCNLVCRLLLEKKKKKKHELRIMYINNMKTEEHTQ